MSLSSYDNLLKQVENLKMENSHLKLELQDNSSCLTKLESEASNMKNVLTHLQTAMDEDLESNYQGSPQYSSQSSCDNDNLQVEALFQNLTTSGDNLDQNSNSSNDDTTGDPFWIHPPSNAMNNQYKNPDPQPAPVDPAPADAAAASEAEAASPELEHPQPREPSPEPSPAGSPEPSPEASPRPSPEASPRPSPEASPELSPEASPEPSPEKEQPSPIQGGGESPGNMGAAQKPSPGPSPPSPTGTGAVRKRPRTKEIYARIQELDQTRTSVVQEIENEDKQRQWYCDQLQSLQSKIDSLSWRAADGYNLQADMARRQLEYEVQRIRELMKETLGTSEQIAQRHEARLQRIRIIEADMLNLQTKHRQQCEEEKRDSGTCDHVETDQDGVIVSDASTNTSALVGTEVYIPRHYKESDVAAQQEDGLHCNGPNGINVVTIATQTAEHFAPETPLPFEGQCSSNQSLSALYHGAWPIENTREGQGSLSALANQETASVMSFNSSNVSASTTGSQPSRSSRGSHHQLGTKVEMVYSLLSMLGTHDKDDMSRTLLAMSSSQDSCIAMRQSGCLPLLIQLLHGSDKDSGLLGNTRGSKSARARAAAALHNIVHSHPDDKRGRREARVLRLLEQIRAHCDQLRGSTEDEDEEGSESNKSRPGSGSADMDHHPGPAIAALMKLSFDEEHRHAICTLGGLQAIAELLQLDHEMNGNTMEQYNITMRRYACMALTNLTFGDGTNKALLCSMKSSMRALVAQLHSPNEDLRQVAASVLRNLSWRADLASKKTLREVGSVSSLMQASMEVTKESTLKSVLSALWNLSAHCSENKADICVVDNSLAFLVTTLTYKSPSKTLAIIENGGGILRNVSSHIAVREDYREFLRHHNCLPILLKHLRSPSLTIVSNACGTLWNLSARCVEDQKALWEMGAVSMLRNLVHSKHKMISMGSAAALKNLLSARPNLGSIEGDRFSKTSAPGLHVRKQRAMEAELDQNLSETCENLESPHGSPTEQRKHEPISRPKYVYSVENCGIYPVADSEQRRSFMRGAYYIRGGGSGENSPLAEHKIHSPQRSVSRSGSQDSVGSTHSDISHDRGRVYSMLMKSTKLLQERQPLGYERRRDMLYQQNGPSGSDSPKPRQSESAASQSGASGSGSRIVQVMQEVALCAGLDSADRSFEKEKNVDKSATPSSSSRRTEHSDRSRASKGHTGIPMYRSRNGSEHSGSSSKSSSEDSSQNNVITERINLNYTTQTRRMENLHLNLPEQDEPINYSMKYPERQASSSSQMPNNQVTQSQNSAFVKPIPKVQNFVGSGTFHYSKTQGSKIPAQVKGGVEDKSLNVSSSSSGRDDSIQKFSGYAETDLDTEDQPTNFSIRFAEQADDDDDEAQESDQPINYSTRFQESESSCADCKLEEARRTNEFMEQTMPGVNDDTVHTFYTEGTPLTFLSTATSMNDLREVKGGDKDDEAKKPARKPKPPADAKHLTDDHKLSIGTKSVDSMSGTGSQSTDRNTSSTIVQQQQQQSQQIELSNAQNNNVPAQASPPSMYSYGDSTGTSSPSEKPKQYCTEGTPTCFSIVSSLSSLHSSEDLDQPPGPLKQQDCTLQAIDENDDSLNRSQNLNDVTLKPEQQQDHSFQSSANTSLSQASGDPTPGAGKTVTFDENNQVQDTPMMFSRCSSLGSLSSFDSHSVHSSVVSEYSRRASEVVSPSELPDSPSDTMPSTPSHRKSPVKFCLDEEGSEQQPEKKKPEASDKTDKARSEDKLRKLATIPEGGEPQRRAEAPPPQQSSRAFADIILGYADEGSPPGTFSSGTSISALTIDDEPKIEKEPGMRILPLGQETDGLEAAPGVDFTLMADEQNDLSSDLSIDSNDNSEVSEGEENLLAECISLAMPTNSSKKKMKKSLSDGLLKKRTAVAKGSGKKSKLSMKTSSSFPSAALAARASRVPLLGLHRPSGAYAQHQLPDETSMGHDTPQNFETEGTPLNFSRAESLSDISMGSDDGENTCPTQQQAGANKPSRQGVGSEKKDDGSDLSSLSDDDDDDDDLLSEAIEAAMPKSKRKSTLDRKAEAAAAAAKQKVPHKASGVRKPVAVPSIGSTEQQPKVIGRRAETGPGIHAEDTVQTYAVEGTPINFSRATSFSDLTIDMNDGGDGCSESGLQHSGHDPLSSNEHSVLANPEAAILLNAKVAKEDTAYSQGVALDSPKVFGMEGTPRTFSRNDSLSSLSGDDEDEYNVPGGRLSAPEGPLPQRGYESPQTKSANASPHKSGIQSPAIARLKQSSGRSARHEPSSTSTPMTKQKSPSGTHNKPTSDQLQTYAVEGTPMCFSRNSSLSSLENSDHEDMNKSPAAKTENDEDNNSKFLVEDTPAVMSDNSSLSSLSVESLSFEPTEQENALLEECISAAMPKSRKKKKKESPLHRTSPSGSADDASKRKTPKTELFASPGSSSAEMRAVLQAQQSKNVEGPQAEKEDLTQKSRDDDPDYVTLEQIEAVTHKTIAKTDSHTSPAMTESSASDSRMVDSLDSLDGNKLSEVLQETESQVAAFGLTASGNFERSFCLGATDTTTDVQEKEDLPEKFILLKESMERRRLQNRADSTDSLTMGCRPLEHSSCSSELVDIMKESFPEMSSSLVSNITTPDITKEVFPDMSCSLVSNVTTPDDEQQSVTLNATGNETTDSSADTTVLSSEATFIYNGPAKEQQDEEESSSFLDTTQGSTDVDQDDDTVAFYLPDEMEEGLEQEEEGETEQCPEDEMALEENANIILSELSINRELSNSTLDDDMFIDNETISLVSNDYTSDTASEVSVSLSSSSKTASEHNSDMTSSTLSHHSSVPTLLPRRPLGPRILKPDNPDVERQRLQEDVKGIRGGKKRSSYGQRAMAAASAARSASGVKIETGISIRGGGKPSPGIRGGRPSSSSRLVGSTPPKKTTAGRGISPKAAAVPPPKAISTTPKSAPQTRSSGISPKTAGTPGKLVTPPKSSGPSPKASGLQSKVTSAAPKNVQARKPSGTPPKSSESNLKTSTSGKSLVPSRPGTSPGSAKVLARKTSFTGSSSPKVKSATQSPAASPKLARSTKIAAGVKPATPPRVSSKTGLGSGIPKKSSPRNSQDNKSLSTETSPKQRLNNETDDVERPKPPIKQGTFTKDSPTQNAPEISPVLSKKPIDVNGNSSQKRQSLNADRYSAELKYVNDASEKPVSSTSAEALSGMPCRKSSPGSEVTKEKRRSGESLLKKQSPPAWSKALETYNFLMDSNKEEGAVGAASASAGQTAAQKSVGPPQHQESPKGVSPSRGSPQSASSRMSPVAGRALPSKVGWRGSLANAANKSGGSGSSLNVTSSNNSLSSKGSNNSSKTPPRKTTSVECKDDSQTSGEKSDAVRAPTPTRRLSSGSGSGSGRSPSGKTGGVAGRTSGVPSPTSKLPCTEDSYENQMPPPPPLPISTRKPPVSSKIANLWRRDRKKSEDKGKKSSDKGKEEKPKSPKSSKHGLSGGKVGKSKKNEKAKESKAGESVAPNGGLKRSSTYDKLTPETMEVANAAASSSSTTINTTPTSQDRDFTGHIEIVHDSLTSRLRVNGEVTSGDQPPPLPPRNSWRKTYTVPAEGDKSAPVNSDSERKDAKGMHKGKHKDGSKRHSLSLWKRHHDSEKDKHKSHEGPSEAKLEAPKKKGFSLWRRDSAEAKSSSKEESKTPPTVTPEAGTSNSGHGPGHWFRKSREADSNSSSGIPAPSHSATKKVPEPPRRVEGSSLPVAAVKSTPNAELQKRGESDGRPGVVSVGGSPITSPSRSHPPANAAIVTPFNYNPNQQSKQSASVSASASSSSSPKQPHTQPLEVETSNSQQREGQEPSSPTRHMTKTEMLIERRRRSYLTSLNSLKNDENTEAPPEVTDESKRSACLVTTV